MANVYIENYRLQVMENGQRVHASNHRTKHNAIRKAREIIELSPLEEAELSFDGSLCVDVANLPVFLFINKTA